MYILTRTENSYAGALHLSNKYSCRRQTDSTNKGPNDKNNTIILSLFNSRKSIISLSKNPLHPLLFCQTCTPSVGIELSHHVSNEDFMSSIVRHHIVTYPYHPLSQGCSSQPGSFIKSLTMQPFRPNDPLSFALTVTWFFQSSTVKGTANWVELVRQRLRIRAEPARDLDGCRAQVVQDCDYEQVKYT